MQCVCVYIRIYKQEGMRNQSVKNPKVFPASTATLGDTLRNGVSVRVCTGERGDQQNSCIMDSFATRRDSREKPFGWATVRVRQHARTHVSIYKYSEANRYNTTAPYIYFATFVRTLSYKLSRDERKGGEGRRGWKKKMKIRRKKK